MENYAQIDYSDIDSKYTDDYIYAQITAAEEFVEAYTGITLSSSTTGGLLLAIKRIAERRMRNQLIRDGYTDGKNNEQIMDPIDNVVLQLLDGYLKQNSVIKGYEYDDLTM